MEQKPFWNHKLMSQKWIIKDSLDQVSGPFETPEVIRRIHQGLITEQDFLASYPEGKWIPVTRNQTFFDEMLAALSKFNHKKSPSKETANGIQKNQKIDTDVELRDDESTKTETLDSLKINSKNSNVKSTSETNFDPTEALSATLKLEKTSHDDAKKKNSKESYFDKTKVVDVQDLKSNSTASAKSEDATQINKNLPQSASKKPYQYYAQNEVLDLRKHRHKSFVEKNRKLLSLLILVLSVLGSLIFFLPQNSEDITSDSFKLRTPRFNRNPMDKAAEKASMSIALKKIKKGSFNNFREAHNELIKVLESNGQNLEALTSLCFTDYHLWEFTQKTSKDIFAISTITKKAVELDRFGEQGKICRFVDLAVRGKYDEAQKVIDDVLDSEQGSTSILFSYFNGLIKFVKKEYLPSESYMSAAISRSRQIGDPKNNNEYAVMWVALADANLKLGKANFAYKSTLRALTINPEYVDALLIRGIIEFKNQRKKNLAKTTLQRALKLIPNDKPNKKKLSEAYVVLAEIALFERRRTDAQEYAIKAYNYNPGNSVAKNLAIELGANKKVGKKTVLSQQLVIEGEQNLQESGCVTAQALFKEAYKLDNKNGYAALKTAQCLWELSFALEAIIWIEKSIQADPSLIEAYVTASKFYMERYDFDSAMQVLIKARKVSPRSYEVYRGLANLELKRKNIQLAIEYAKVALKIYDADTDTLVVLAKAYLELNQNQEAFQYIVRASENDSRSVEVHTTYGRVLYKTQGIFAAQEYLKNRIAGFPLEPAYRITLAEIYFEDQKYREAEISAKEALEFNDNSKQAFMILGKTLKIRNEKQAALNYFLDAFSVDPSDVEPLFEAGQLYIDIQKYDEAIKQFERVLKLNSKYPEIYYNLAKVHFAQRKMNQAIKFCRKEVDLYPERDDCFKLIAEAYFFKGSKERDKLAQIGSKKINANEFESIENQKKTTYDKMIDFYRLCADHYQKAIDVAQQNANLYIDLSRCYRFAGEFDMSQKMVEKALEIEKGNPLVWRENGLIFEQKGEYALALEAYKQYLILNPTANDRSEIIRQMRELESKITP